MAAPSPSPQLTTPAAGTPAPARLRLAVLTDAVYPWHAGGKEIRQHELLRRIARQGITVDVYTMKWWSSPGDLHRDGITYHAICPLIPLYRGERRSIRQALAFAAAGLRLATARFDVLEADMVPVLQVFTARLVAWLRRRPLTVTWHEFWGREYWTDYLGPAGHLAAALEAGAARLPGTIVAASEGTRARLRAVLGSSGPRIACIPNGISAREVAQAAASEPAVRADLVVAGRLLAHKNVDVALRALQLLRRDGQQLTMAIIGDGPERERLERLSGEPGLAGAVTFTGALPGHRDVLATIAHARALVFPSVREGFGMVALEAMAAGTPVITADHPDNLARDLVVPDVTGLVVPPRPETVAAALSHVLAHRERMSAAARERALSYDWEELATAAAKEYLS